MSDDKTFDLLAQLINETGDTINPATEDKQDDIITELQKLVGQGVSTDIAGRGDITVGTSEVEIDITGTTESIRIRADKDNTGIIYIGKTGVQNDGSNDFVRLEKRDEVIIDYDDANNALYAISDTAAQKINVGALL